MKIKFCPKCRGTEIQLVIGGKIGLLECKKCGFRSAIFPEKEFKINKKKK